LIQPLPNRGGFEPERTGLDEDELALNRLAEHDAVQAGDEP
jgi:hypothetical protein